MTSGSRIRWYPAWLDGLSTGFIVSGLVFAFVWCLLRAPDMDVEMAAVPYPYYTNIFPIIGVVGIIVTLVWAWVCE